MRNKRIEYIIDEILDQYAYADESTRPWIIGFSGGKDSTVLLMLVWIALEKLKELPGPFQLRRPIYVVCNDTMVENPIIASYVDQVLEQIEKKSKRRRLAYFCSEDYASIGRFFLGECYRERLSCSKHSI